MIIRRVTAADADTVLAIQRATQPTPWTLGRFGGFSTLVAEVDGWAVGFACHSVNRRPGGDEMLVLANLSVDAGVGVDGNGWRFRIESRTFSG